MLNISPPLAELKPQSDLHFPIGKNSIRAQSRDKGSTVTTPLSARKPVHHISPRYGLVSSITINYSSGAAATQSALIGAEQWARVRVAGIENGDDYFLPPQCLLAFVWAKLFICLCLWIWRGTRRLITHHRVSATLCRYHRRARLNYMGKCSFGGKLVI